MTQKHPCIEIMKTNIQDAFSELLGLRVTCADFVHNQRWTQWWIKVTENRTLADNFAIMFDDLDGKLTFCEIIFWHQCTIETVIL